MFHGPSFQGMREVLVDSDEQLIVECLVDKPPASYSEYTTAICQNAPLTIKAGKRIIRDVLKTEDADMDLARKLILDCFESEDYAEGRRAFMEKRKPVFKGK